MNLRASGTGHLFITRAAMAARSVSRNCRVFWVRYRQKQHTRSIACVHVTVLVVPSCSAGPSTAPHSTRTDNYGRMTLDLAFRPAPNFTQSLNSTFRAQNRTAFMRPALPRQEATSFNGGKSKCEVIVPPRICPARFRRRSRSTPSTSTPEPLL